MELSREDFNELVDKVLEIMLKTGEREPCVNSALEELRESVNISDSVANCIANEAYFDWDEIAWLIV